MKKHEREIAELLEKMDKFIPDDSPRRRPKRGLSDLIHRAAQAIPAMPATRNISSTSLIVASFVLAFLANILRDFYRPVGPIVSIISVALFLAALVLFAIRQRRHPERRWRGRVIKIESYRPYSFTSLSYRWRRIWKSLWQRPGKKY